VLRRLLNQVLNDPTVAGHRARISAIIAELDADADSAGEAQPNTPIRRPTIPASQKTPDPDDIVLFSHYKQVVDQDRRVIAFLAKATSSKRLVSNLEVNLDGKDAHQILDMLDLTSTPFIDDQVDKTRKRFRKSVQRFADTWFRDHPMKTTDEEWLDVEEKISYRNKWFTLGEEIVQAQRELFRVARSNNLDRDEPVPQPGIGELTATYETQRDNQSPLIGLSAGSCSPVETPRAR
jgi:hypothetical protein